VVSGLTFSAVVFACSCVSVDMCNNGFVLWVKSTYS
jgi:hypothetical protein